MYHADFCESAIGGKGNILDVGFGDGDFLLEMAGRNFDVYGVETVPERVESINRKIKELGKEGDLREGRAESLPFKDNQFVFVNCAEVTEHVDDPILVCREIYRVLKPGGKGYVSFHNRFGFFDYHYHLPFINWMPRSWAGKLLKFFGKEKEDGVNGRQKLSTMHYYTYKQSVELLEKIGFKVRDVREEKIIRKFGILSGTILLAYKLKFRSFYFNSFHLLVEK